ncbi:UDP-4-amino-4-deoxy-L-arabinose--oxoglutarate aminotransferase [Rhodobacteraceae bacterium THAF1]|uniref:DegT/DnrJ/EryC1/StrS family aminotransferase n=1 Tax=Palleronia sp. THAF1 TaxID=2587842 RepID=UPI000F3D7E1D|nr:DegT/DnrJ/EryC1/StrS family aminotransferase [Palleronia sp. THAF1]QFU10081.1 UDP-4-amino-4-deoxy-L-arabinose--oxoglutarate aminotransferase [Palleronia sp. THAF1]VDC17014.1 UDP-4-amino-4-deoxy-L-arabinose--oxoglutarate aminotransferase [Rhodobacteraceae bacterium THAF1]
MNHSNVPFFRPSIGDAEIDAVTKVMRSGWLTTASEAPALEKSFEEYLGGDVHALAVTSATAALHLGLDALGVGPGDEVILPTLTFTATAEVVRYMGATPVLVDIDPATLCLSVDGVRTAITPRTKTVMPVHFAGRACDMAGLRALADAHGLTILDDAAHALPAKTGGALIGSAAAQADATAFSFYANKTMTTGEGGMLIVADADRAARSRTMRLHGIDRDVFKRFTDTKAPWIYDVVAPGFKYNLTDMAAAIGRVQFSRLSEFLDARTTRAAIYDDALSDLPLTLPPHAAPGDMHSWHLYCVRIREDAPLSRDAFINAMKDEGIGTSVHYRPLHQMTYWRHLVDKGKFPNADAYFERCVTLPLFMSMTDDEQARVITVVRQILS